MWNVWYWFKQFFSKSKTWCDSGYDDDKNRETCIVSKFNFKVIPKKLATQINKELRKRNTLFTNEDSKKGKKKSKSGCKKKTDAELDDISIKDCIRIINGYLCPYGHIIKLVDVKDSNCKYNKQEGLIKELVKKIIFINVKIVRDVHTWGNMEKNAVLQIILNLLVNISIN